MGGLIDLVGQKTQIPFNLPKYIHPHCEITIFPPENYPKLQRDLIQCVSIYIYLVAYPNCAFHF